jgi:hypothetical protein
MARTRDPRELIASDAERVRMGASLRGNKPIDITGDQGGPGNTNATVINPCGGSGTTGGTVPSGYGGAMKPGGQIAPVGTAFVDFLNAVGAANTDGKYKSPYFKTAVYGSETTPGYQAGDFRAYVTPLEDKKKKNKA